MTLDIQRGERRLSVRVTTERADNIGRLKELINQQDDVTSLACWV